MKYLAVFVLQFKPSMALWRPPPNLQMMAQHGSNNVVSRGKQHFEILVSRVPF
jgi:hypothetical protein